MDFFIILLSPYLINNNSYRFKNYIAFIYSLKKLSETRRTNLSNTKEFTRSSTFNNKLENGLSNKTLINTRELSSLLGKIMFAYLKRLWWDCVLPMVSMKVENYAELSFSSLGYRTVEQWALFVDISRQSNASGRQTWKRGGRTICGWNSGFVCRHVPFHSYTDLDL